MARQSLQRKYHLKDAPCDPCMVHCCMHWCALCQEHREMKSCLVDNAVETTIVDPPPAKQLLHGLKVSEFPQALDWGRNPEHKFCLMETDYGSNNGLPPVVGFQVNLLFLYAIV